MSDPLLTIIVATYNRPEPLRVALRSAVLQTEERWRMLVVGDCCDEHTGEAIASLGDQRIRYINLPERFGEQSGPNSIGLALAETPFVAFLNHDDVYLPDHLQRAVSALETEKTDFYVGRSAIARHTDVDPEGRRIPVFSKADPLDRGPEDAFVSSWTIFEPISAWVLRTATARSTGDWRSAVRLYRSPAQDWFLRAWRGKARFSFARTVTVLQVTTHWEPGDSAGYRRPTGEYAHLERLINSSSADAIRAGLLRDIDTHRRWKEKDIAAGLGTRKGRIAYRLFFNRFTARVYYYTGWDTWPLDARIRGRERGYILREFCKARTGRELPPPPDFAAAVAAARTQLRGVP